MAHTPGPWNVNPQPDPTAPRYATIYVKPGDHTTVDHVAQVGEHLTKHSGDWQANARLIAAAPDLLAAAKNWLQGGWEGMDLKDYVNFLDEAKKLMQQAVLKAEVG